NGAPSTLADWTLAGRLPALVMSSVAVCCWPTGTEPKLTGPADGDIRLSPAVALPVSPTVTEPADPWITNDEENVPAADGWKVTVTTIDWPGPSVVPVAGSPAALNGPAGAVVDWMVSAA